VEVWWLETMFYTITVSEVVPAGIGTKVGLKKKSCWSTSMVPPLAMAVPWSLTDPESLTGGLGLAFDAVLATAPGATRARAVRPAATTATAAMTTAAAQKPSATVPPQSGVDIATRDKDASTSPTTGASGTEARESWGADGSMGTRDRGAMVANANPASTGTASAPMTGGSAGDVLRALQESERGRRLVAERITPHQRRFGYKSIYSHEFRFRLWVENPAPVIEAIRGYVATDYDFEAIHHLVQDAAESDAAWAAYFAEHSIEPCKVVYEDFVDEYASTLLQILGFLGISRPDSLGVEKRRLLKQADAMTEIWVHRYLSAISE